MSEKKNDIMKFDSTYITLRKEKSAAKGKLA
jgi:hypothetical protein